MEIPFVSILLVTFDQFNASLLKIQTIERLAPMQFQLQIHQHGNILYLYQCNFMHSFN